MTNPPKKTLPRPGRKTKIGPKTAGEQSLVSDNEQKQPQAGQPTANSRQIAILAARAGLEKKATGIEIIDVTGKVDYADYLVLMTGASDRNVAAIAQEVDAELAKAGFRSMAIEGLPAAQWVLIDFVDVVVHVFQRDVRSLYDLDGLWMDAARIPMETTATAPVAKLVSSEEPVTEARKPRARSSKSVSGVKPRPSSAKKAPAKRTTKATKSAPVRGSATPRSKAARKGARSKSDG